ncbi:MAG: DUF4838 domain-containing protein, partial [Verrucomicrobia bacterium]|nr:DUF4838 domain-containing protein [Verrucomicrobiota bacterium]
VYVEHPAYLWGSRRMRMAESRDDQEPFVNASHHLYRIFPPSVYAQSHPEYYAMRGGKRMSGLTNPDTNWNLCFSNTEVIEVAAKSALAAFRAHRFNQSFSLGINDTGVFCECPKCQDLQPKRTFRGPPVNSDAYFHFVNEVARRVATEFPDRYIGCIAYSSVMAPPLAPVEKNVHVVIGNDISEYYDKDYQKADEELVGSWEKKGVTLGQYTYLGLGKLVPAYFPHLVDQEMKDKHKRGFKSVRSEVYPGWPWNGPMAYVTARLWWDVNLNVDDLLTDYFSTLYGKAAEPMRKLYALFEEIHLRPRRGGFLYEHYQFRQFRPYTGADVATMRLNLSQAHRAVPEGEAAQRVAYVSNGLQVFLNMLEGMSIAQNAKPTGEFTDVSACRRLEEIEHLNNLMNNHDALYRETITSDAFQSDRYTRDTCTGLRQEWKTFLSAAIVDSLVDLHRWSTVSAMNPEVKARIQSAIVNFTADHCRKAMFQIKSGIARFGPNLVRNPGFEEVETNASHAQGPEWLPAQADGWALWRACHDKGSFNVAEKEKHSGNRSGRIKGVGAGCYLSTVPKVKEGELYYLTAYAKSLAKSEAMENKTTLAIEVRWFDEKGKWWDAPAPYRTESRNYGEWVKMETIALVPAGAGSAVIFLAVNDLEDEQEIFFDDVSFRKIETEKAAEDR